MVFYIVPNDHLEHHGIKGQSWGVRNGPPYPLKPSQHSAAEKKESSSGLNKKGDATVAAAYLLAFAAAHITASAVARGAEELQKMNFRKNNPTGQQLYTEWAPESEQKWYKENREKEREFAKKVTKESDLKKKENPGTPEEDMAAVNPNYRRGREYQANCMYCAAAFDLRRRGYDVQARERNVGGMDLEISEWYKDAKPTAYNTAAEVLDAARKQPNGARGMISGQGPWGGHELAYEVNDNKLTIYDAQGNKTWKESQFKKFYAQGTVTRLDNCEPNWKTIGEVISEDSVNKRGKKS